MHKNDGFHETYLKIASAYNSGKPQIRTGDALKQLKVIIDNTGPMNPLHDKAADLRDQIIQMDNNTRKAPGTPATILAFPKKKS